MRTLGKAVDLGQAKLFLLSRAVNVSNPPEVRGSLRVFRIVVFEDVEDLLEKVGSIVASEKPGVRN